MKRALTTLALAIFCWSIVSAQVTLRPYLGFNTSELSEDLVKDSATFANNVGFQVGADLQIGDKFYVQPGVQLEFLNNTIEPRSGGEEDLKRTYLRIPVMVGYNFAGAESNFGFRVFTGPNMGINMSSKSDLGDVEEEVKNAIFGWNAGLGIDFISILFVDLGYQVGLTEVFEDTNLNTGARNNLFYGNAGLRVRF
ncbi:MAG: outer membrane beta-barrel protein [Saprospiraceae bacterium]|jgi:hypothetical protein